MRYVRNDPLVGLAYTSLYNYPAPSNLTYFWNFGIYSPSRSFTSKRSVSSLGFGFTLDAQTAFSDPFLFQCVFYGFILWTIFGFIVYLRYTQHTGLWRIFKKFLFGSSKVEETVSLFKLKLLTSLITFRVLFIGGLNAFIALHGVAVELNGILFLVLDFLAVLFADLLFTQFILSILSELTGGFIFGFRAPLLTLGSSSNPDILHSGQGVSKGVGMSKEATRMGSRTHLSQNRVSRSFGVAGDNGSRSIHKAVWEGKLSNFIEHVDLIPRDPYQKIFSDKGNLESLIHIADVSWFNSNIDSKIVHLHTKAHFIYATSDVGFQINRFDYAHVHKTEKSVNKVIVKALENKTFNSPISDFDFIKLIRDCSDYLVDFNINGKDSVNFVKDSPLTKFINCFVEVSDQTEVLRLIHHHFMIAYNQLDVSILINNAFCENVCFSLTGEINFYTSKIRSAIFRIFNYSADQINFAHPYADHLIVVRRPDGSLSIALIDQKNLKGFDSKDGSKEEGLTISSIYDSRFDNFLKSILSAEIGYEKFDSISHFDIFRPSRWLTKIDSTGKLKKFEIIELVNAARAKESKNIENHLISKIIIPNFEKARVNEFNLAGSTTSSFINISGLEENLPLRSEIIKSKDSFFIKLSELDLIDRQIEELKVMGADSGTAERDKKEISAWIKYLEQNKEWVEKLDKEGLKLSRSFTAYMKKID